MTQPRLLDILASSMLTKEGVRILSSPSSTEALGAAVGAFEAVPDSCRIFYSVNEVLDRASYDPMFKNGVLKKRRLYVTELHIGATTKHDSTCPMAKLSE